MPDPPFESGDTIRIRATLTDAETGSPVMPSQIQLRVKQPDTSVATFGPVASVPLAAGSGIYQVDYVLPQVGSYAWRWQATGPNTAEEGTFSTATSRF